MQKRTWIDQQTVAAVDLNDLETRVADGDSAAEAAAKAHADSKDTANRSAWASADVTVRNQAAADASSKAAAAEANAKAYADGKPAGSLIVSGTDLDAVQTPGNYYQDDDADATVGLHYPVGSAGALVVHRWNDAGARIQVFTPWSVDGIFVRRLYGGVWGSWVKFDTATQVAASISTALDEAKGYADTKDSDNRAAWAAADATVKSEAATDASTKAGAAESNAKTYTDTTAVAKTDPRLPGETGSYAYAWADRNGNVALGVLPDGATEVQGVATRATGDTDPYAYAWADSRNRVALGVKADGTVEVGGAPVATAQAAKVSPLALTLSAGTSTDTRSAVHVRYPFSPTVDVRVKAVHIRNYNERSAIAFTGALSVTGVWIGSHKVDHTGLTGQFTAAPSQVSGAFTTGAGGEEYVISGLDIPLSRNSEHLLSLAYTCTEGQTNHKGVGACWTTPGTADASALAPAGMVLDTMGPLDVWLEIEHTAPVTAWLGDSIWCGVGNRHPVYTAPGVLHARAHGHVPMLYCHSGSAMTSWTAGSASKYQRWSSMSRPAAVVWELGRNDVSDTIDVATLRSRFDTLRPVVAQQISTNIYMTTVTPRRAEDTSADSAVRREWNEVILNELQGGPVREVFDLSRAVAVQGGVGIDPALDADGLHFTTRGSAAMAKTIVHPLV